MKLLRAVFLALLLGGLFAAVTPTEGSVEVYWWQHNDGTPVYVPESFYYDALKIVVCETGGTWNDQAVGRLGESSWFQIHPIHRERFERRGWSWDDAWDPGKNTEIALEIWNEQGWGPWSCRYVVGGG